MKLKRPRSSRQLFSILAILTVVALGFVLTVPAFSYLSMFTRTRTGQAVPDHWDFTAFPVQFSINPSVGSNMNGGGSPVNIITQSFATWVNAPNTALQVSRGPDTTKSASGFDGVNLICFICSADFSGVGNSTLAVTITTTADAPGEDTKHGSTSQFAGQILDADIIFNPNVQWATGSTVTGDQQHLQTVATHEIGHFFGLDHSGVVRAVMYPYAPDLQTQLGYDDVAGISQVYPKSNADFATGKISGTVKFSSGAGVFGAHVFADSNSATLGYGPTIRKTPISTMSLPDGTYTIAGVPPDSYIVTAEPLDGPVENSDISGYASAFAKSGVQTGFNTRWH